MVKKVENTDATVAVDLLLRMEQFGEKSASVSTCTVVATHTQRLRVIRELQRRGWIQSNGELGRKRGFTLAEGVSLQDIPISDLPGATTASRVLLVNGMNSRTLACVTMEEVQKQKPVNVPVHITQ